MDGRGHSQWNCGGPVEQEQEQEQEKDPDPHQRGADPQGWALKQVRRECKLEYRTAQRGDKKTATVQIINCKL
jgi:hypothetical protein